VYIDATSNAALASRMWPFPQRAIPLEI